MQKVHWDYLLLLAEHNLGIGVRHRYGEPSRGMFGSIELEIRTLEKNTQSTTKIARFYSK